MKRLIIILILATLAASCSQPRYAVSNKQKTEWSKQWKKKWKKQKECNWKRQKNRR